MRHLVLALMIALLPLRGWAGDLMATNMAAKVAAKVASQTAATSAAATAATAVATELGAARAHKTGAAASFEPKNQGFQAFQAAEAIESVEAAQIGKAVPDCHEHLAQPQELEKTPANGHCNTCLACQACHTVGLAPAVPAGAATLLPRTQPRLAAVHFVSAITALGQKPPIS